MLLVDSEPCQLMRWTPLTPVSCYNPQTTQESMTCYQMSIVKATKIKYLTKRELVDSVRAVIIVDLTRWRAISRFRWGKPCSTVTSWLSCDRATLATLLRSITLDRLKQTNTTCPWWPSTTEIRVGPAPLEQPHPAWVITELERPVELVTRMLPPIKLTSSTWWTNGRPRMRTLANNSKWWWLRNFSIPVAIMLCSLVQETVEDTKLTIRYQRLLPKPSWDSRGLLVEQATRSTRATVATSAPVRLNTKMPLVKLLPTSSTRLGSIMEVDTTRASSQSTVTWAAEPTCRITADHSTLATLLPSVPVAAT